MNFLRKIYMIIGVITLVFLSGCSSTGSTVKVERSVIPPNTYKYTLVETYKSRPHGLDGLYSVNTHKFYYNFYTTKLGWVDGENVKIETNLHLSMASIDKSKAKFYFGKSKLIIKNLTTCTNSSNECAELRINGEHKVDVIK